LLLYEASYSGSGNEINQGNTNTWRRYKMINARLTEDNLMFTMEMLEMHYIANIEDFIDDNENDITINGETFKLNFEGLLGFGRIAYWFSENFIVRSCPYFDFQDGEALNPLYVEVTDRDLKFIGIAINEEIPITSYEEYVKMTIQLTEAVFKTNGTKGED
jgi:hypothetical protein